MRPLSEVVLRAWDVLTRETRLWSWEALERGGGIRLIVEKRRDRKTLHRFVEEHAPDAEKVYTDDFEAYKGIEDEDTKHETVNHSTEEYVRGDVHTNSVEGGLLALQAVDRGGVSSVRSIFRPI